MDKQQQLGLLGCIILAIGVFLPVVTMINGITFSYFKNGEGDGAFILILCIISGFMNFNKVYHFMWIPAGISLISLIVSFIGIFKITSASDELIKPDLGIGWLIMFIGIILIMISSSYRIKKDSE